MGKVGLRKDRPITRWMILFKPFLSRFFDKVVTVNLHQGYLKESTEGVLFGYGNLEIFAANRQDSSSGPIRQSKR